MNFAFSDEQLAALGERGLLVIDHVGGDHAARAAAEAAISVDGSLTTAGISRQHEHAAQVRGDRTVFLDESELNIGFVDVIEALKAIQAALREQAWLTVPRREFQLACYDGVNVGYARHLDAFRGASGVTGHRRVTIVYYLNLDWQPVHGGALRCFDDDNDDDSNAAAEGAGHFVDVEPILDRAVIFLSERVHHAVLPSTHRRCALTLWMSPS